MNTPARLTSDSPEISRHLPADQPIVIADADEENAHHVERQLRRAGLKNPVVMFQDGDALHAFLAEAALNDAPVPCVLFLDPRMPGANGYDPVRWVKRETRFSATLVAIFTSPDAADETERATELGVHVFLKKLPDLGSLATIVDHFCDALPAETESLPAPIGEIKLA